MQLTWKVSKVFTKADLKKLEEYRQYVLKIAEQEKGKSLIAQGSVHWSIPVQIMPMPILTTVLCYSALQVSMRNTSRACRMTMLMSGEQIN